MSKHRWRTSVSPQLIGYTPHLRPSGCRQHCSNEKTHSMTSSNQPHFCLSDPGYFMEGIHSQCFAACFCGTIFFFFLMQYLTAVWLVSSRGQTKTGPLKSAEIVNSLFCPIHLAAIPESPPKSPCTAPHPMELGHFRTTECPYFCSHLSSLGFSTSPFNYQLWKLTQYSQVSN